jgi:HD-GYP domain-containing protein (c-di-GMP phosphodiesterase class II)
MSFTRAGPTIFWMLLAEKLVGEARERRAREMDHRERQITGFSAVAFIAAAAAIAAIVPNDRSTSPLVVAGLAVGYVLVVRVRFEFGGYYGTAEQLMIMPMVLLAPLPFVPVLIGLCAVAASLPEIHHGVWHRDRAAERVADCWFAIPPVVVLALLASGEPDVDKVPIYLLAFAAQLGGDFVYSVIRNRLLDRLPMRELATSWIGTARVDAIFTPIAILATLPAADHPWTLLALAPLPWLLHSFARDRQERYAKTLELHRAYRGTVMLLSDVVEFEDEYTGQHSRSVVDLANAVADQLGVPDEDRQELEFAAMLHDVGKITIPKEILNKPSRLTEEEFELMKQHTLEGQFMLDRVGGLLARVGEIVRSCHERWDGQGYPDGLRGEQIPFASRIVFCCDAFHAMTSDRSYRAAMPRQSAVTELRENAGTQFDPVVVDALVKVVEQGEPVGAAADEVRAVLASTPIKPDLAAGTSR